MTNIENFPSGKTSDASPETLESRFQRVERARRSVEQTVFLDSYLDTPGAHTVDDFVGRYLGGADNIHPALRERFLQVIEAWDRQSEGHARVQASLERMAQERFGVATPEACGAVVFQGICCAEDFNTTLQPEGSVSSFMRGPFLVVYIPNSHDHDRMGTRGSGGTFHRSRLTTLQYRDEDLFPNILMVHGSPETGESQNIVEHERQHFIQHEWMKPPEGADIFALRTHAMKDEILACLRDGSDGAQISRYLRTDLYAHLYAGLDADERKKIEALLAEVVRAIEGVQGFFYTQASRALLVYHLIDVPLTRFPDVLQLLGQYERDRNGPASRFQIPEKQAKYISYHIDPSLVPPDTGA